jgi:hypothetical protein
MARKNRRKSPFVVTVIAAATAVGSVVACGGNTDAGLDGVGGTGNSSGSGGASTGGTSSGGTGGNDAKCPASWPAHGTPCSLPSSTMCNYDQGSCCPDWGAQCVNGKWEAYASSCNPPPPDPCPSEIPVAGSACGSSEPCGNDYQYCTYGTCADGTPATTAECNGGTWTVTSPKECTLPACETLTACECFARADCMPESEGCLCPCDFNCPGEPPCACACGGGTFLGCKAAPLEG